ncbi:putative protein OS=Streptomyces tendae OX=1932 GN=GUR47_33100 PE=4 SV=1 [Streptomyces tendae]
MPVSRAFPDSDDLLAEALLALSRSGTPAAREILLALAVPSDEVRWERDTPTGPGGTGPGPRRSSCGPPPAGCCSPEPSPHARVRATTAPGTGAPPARPWRTSWWAPSPAAVGLTAFLPVGNARPLAVRLHQALYAAREAVDYRRATGGMEAFDSAVGVGVSHELAEALVALVRGSEGARVAVRWAPAAGVPEGCGALAEPVEFSPGDLPALREAAARYLRAEPSVPVRITGAVVRMRRPGPRGAGTVRLRVLAGAEAPARARRAGRGGLPDRRSRPSRRAAGAGAGAAGGPGRVPPAHRGL